MTFSEIPRRRDHAPLFENNWNTTNIAITAIAIANTIAITMAVNIFGVAEGLRPNAEILAKALAIITAMGPRIHKLNIRTKATFRDIDTNSCLLAATVMTKANCRR